MKETKIANRLGMFDLLKGFGMIVVVVGHTFNSSNGVSSIVTSVLMLIFAVVGVAIMPIFMMISGYGFRKVNTEKCIRQQTKMMLVPYGYTLLGTAVLHFLTRYYLTRSVKTTLRLTWQVVGGFLLAIPAPKEIMGTLYYNCGPMWYMIAVYLGWIILNALMERIPEKYHPAAVFLAVLLGWLLDLTEITFFCLPQALIASGFLYVGYQLKRKKVFQGNWIPTHWYWFALIGVVSVAVCAITGKIDNLADSIWNLGIISILLDSFLSVGVLYLVLLLNNVNFIGQQMIRAIGRNSLYVFAVHTVEMHGIPWYMIQEAFPNNPLMASAITLVLRVAFITVVISAIFYIRSRKSARA